MAGNPADIWLFPVVEVHVSGAVHGCKAQLWQAISNFGNIGDYCFVVDGQPVRTALMPGDRCNQVGAKRVLHLGTGRLYEELTAIDKDKETLTYKLVNDVNNVNPFPASFLNGSTKIRLRSITMSGHVLVELRGRFNTEQSMVAGMRETWQKIYESMITGLQQSLASGKLLEAPAAVPPLRAFEAGLWASTAADAHAGPQGLEAYTAKPFSTEHSLMSLPQMMTKPMTSPFACLPPLARRESLTSYSHANSLGVPPPETPRPCRLNSTASSRSQSSSLSAHDRSGSLAWSMEVDGQQAILVRNSSNGNLTSTEALPLTNMGRQNSMNRMS